MLLGGVGTRTGDAERSFGGLLRFLADAAATTCAATCSKARTPASEVRRRLAADSVRRGGHAAAADRQRRGSRRAASIGTARRCRPIRRLCVLGYSLGGVVGLDGATLAVARDRQGWHGRLGAVVTLAAPVRGCSAGALMNWAWLVTAEPDPLGARRPRPRRALEGR